MPSSSAESAIIRVGDGFRRDWKVSQRTNGLFQFGTTSQKTFLLVFKKVIGEDSPRNFCRKPSVSPTPRVRESRRLRHSNARAAVSSSQRHRLPDECCKPFHLESKGVCCIYSANFNAYQGYVHSRVHLATMRALSARNFNAPLFVCWRRSWLRLCATDGVRRLQR